MQIDAWENAMARKRQAILRQRTVKKNVHSDEMDDEMTEEETEVLRRFAAAHGPATFPFANPFDAIHERLSDLMVQPMRDKHIDSLSLFVHDAIANPRRKQAFQLAHLVQSLRGGTMSEDQIYALDGLHCSWKDIISLARLVCLGVSRLPSALELKEQHKKRMEREAHLTNSVRMSAFKEQYEMYCFENQLRPTTTTTS